MLLEDVQRSEQSTSYISKLLIPVDPPFGSMAKVCKWDTKTFNCYFQKDLVQTELFLYVGKMVG
jgi:hypothetical protein